MNQVQRKIAFVPDRSYISSFGALPVVPVTLPAAPWEASVQSAKPTTAQQPTHASTAPQGVVVMGKGFRSITQAASQLLLSKQAMLENHRAGTLDQFIAATLEREKAGKRKNLTLMRLAGLIS